MPKTPFAIGVAIIASASGAATTTPEAPARAAIAAVLDASAAGWNAGDLDRFMACYDRAPGTSYVSGDTVVRGYDAIRANYARRFAGGDKVAMGALSLKITDFRPLGPNYAYVIGRFQLDRDAAHGGPVSGSTTLVFARTRAGWRIVVDHS